MEYTAPCQDPECGCRTIQGPKPGIPTLKKQDSFGAEWELKQHSLLCNFQTAKSGHCNCTSGFDAAQKALAAQAVEKVPTELSKTFTDTVDHPDFMKWHYEAVAKVKQDSGEERVVDPRTGGAKGRKGIEIGFVDPLALMELGKVASEGSRKYEAFNYLRGFNWSLSYNALQRHALQFWAGEAIDPDSKAGTHHLASVAWHALALLSFTLRDLGTDDRPPESGA